VNGKVSLTNADRWFLVQRYRWFPSILDALSIKRRLRQQSAWRSWMAEGYSKRL